MAVLLQMNFATSRVTARINKMMSEIESEIPRDQERWGQSKSRMEHQLELIKDFAANRPRIVYNELRAYFFLGAAAPVKLAVSGPGAVCVHGLTLDESPMTVNLFKGFPVTVTAVPAAGGVWAGWDDGEMGETRTVMPGEEASLMASFK
jgi:hypothetical protein